MTRALFAIAACLACVAPVQAQSVSARGRVLSSDDNGPLAGVNVFVVPLADTTRQFGGVSDPDGSFVVRLPEPATYRFRITFVGYETAIRILSVPAAGRTLDTIRLVPVALNIDELVVEGLQERVVIKGDTTEYTAGAYKVNPDATAEDLLAKLPGVVVQDGQVEAQGQQVRRVLVDGREFFGDDPTAALRNLPSEVIDKVQVFERLSDQAEFSGFDDGSGEMTVNIITRVDRRNGQFGKVYGGYGSEERYLSGGNISLFDNARRVSIIGMSNNINEQNFSMQDLLGVVGMAGGRGGMGGMRGGGRGGGGGDGPRRGGGNFGGGGAPGGGGMRVSSNPNNFMVGSQGGINQSNAVGINYSDEFGSKVKVSGSYFLNRSDNTTTNFLDREYFLSDTESQFYGESNDASSDNANHRFNLRLQYQIDERNSLIFTPRLSTQSNNAASFISGINSADTGALVSQTINDFVSKTSGMNTAANLLLRHQFEKRGRTLSVNLSGGYNDRDGRTNQLSENTFMDASYDDLFFDQRTDDVQSGYELGTSVTYTEPVGAGGQIQANYSPRISRSDADRRAHLLDPKTNAYSQLEPMQSNTFVNDVMTQRAGLSYRLRAENAFVTVGLNAQQERITGDQTFPVAASVDHNFLKLLPQLTIQYGGRRSNNLRISYRTSTDTPSISQLQDVIDNSNPLQLASGNPNLDQTYSHRVVARFNATNPAAGRVFIGFVSVTTTADFIGSESTVALEETTLENGLVLAPGSQYRKPVNLNGYWNARSFFTLGRPVGFLRSNVNVNAGYSYSATPSVVNGLTNQADVHAINGGAVIGSNISARVDFTLSHTTTYHIIKNSVAPELNSNYTMHRSSLAMNLMPSASWVFSTNVGLSAYRGLGASIDDTSLLWNAALGYKFLKGNGGEVRLLVVDILNQQTSVGRSVNTFYVDDTSSNVLGRYIMLNFTYTLRNYRM